MIKVKLLTESADKLNNIQQHNLNILSNGIWPDGQQISLSFKNDKATIEKIVKEIPSLSNSKIDKPITGKSFGKVFIIKGYDFKRILKLFFGGLDLSSPDFTSGAKKDYKWYKKMYDRLHSGKATGATLPVYGVGEVSTKAGPVNWVEMSELEMFEDFMGRTGRSDKKEYTNDVARISYAYTAYIRSEGGTPPNVSQIISDLLYDGIQKTVFSLTKGEIISLIRALHDITKHGDELHDIAPRNIGVLNPNSKQPYFIVFDN